MTQPINWSQTSDKDKIRLIIEHVLKWQVLEDSMQRRERRWPIVWFDEENQRWMIENTIEDTKSYSLKVFDPLHDMNVAWLVFQEMAGRKEQNSAQFNAFAEAMYEGDDVFWMEIYPASEIYVMAAQWTPEQIYIAALRACGVEVQL